ncbi:MAG TPA: hypothetical protein VHL09_06010 [Dehalococcoidia bacterium]|nr:hypothetical protein [Dehalococcoidia bacterium]
MTFVILIALVVEVAPFHPTYGPFRPFWSDYGPQYNATALDPGRLNPWWLSWGEEVGLLAPDVQRRCQAGPEGATGGPAVDRCDQTFLTLGSTATSDWLDQARRIEIVRRDTDLPHSRYTADDYFVIGRHCFVVECANFPVGIEPEQVLAFRGYVQAWLYRGDRLYEQGFRWTWPANPEDLRGAGAALMAQTEAILSGAMEPLYLSAADAPLAALHSLLATRFTVKVVDPESTVVYREGEPALTLDGAGAGLTTDYLTREATPAAAVPFADGEGAFRFYHLPSGRPPLPPPWRPVDVRWDNGVRLLAVQTSTRRVEPEGPVKVGFAWQPGEATSRRYRFTLALVAPDGRAVDQTIRMGYPAAYWDPGETVLSWHDLRPGPGTPDGVYTIRLSMHTEPFVRRLPLQLNPPADRPVDSVPLGDLVVRARGSQAPADGPVLGGWLRLVAADAPEHGVRGSALPVRLTWRAEAPPAADYTLLVHLLDGQGRLVAQHDAQPLQGALPTTAWLPGEAVTDPVDLALPSTLDPGAYTLIVGAYDARTGQRLSLPDGQGHVVIRQIEVS